MAFDLNTARAAANRTSRNTARDNSNDLPNAEVWANIGFDVEDPETGETVFVGIGVAVDTMKDKWGNSSSPIMRAKSALLQSLIQAGMNLEPGETETLPTLTVQLRRVGGVTQIASDDPYMAAVSALGIGKPKKVA